jgi:hypothetical protein
MGMISRLSLLGLVVGLLGILGAGDARAERYVAVPHLGGAAPGLEMRILRYDGSTNGRMVVEVRNQGALARDFVVDGIFFVPQGDPEKAPQRPGAAGPMVEVAGERQVPHQDRVAMAPGARKELHLEVFCIDSHRASPSPSTRFRVARERLPPRLRQQVKSGTQQILRANEGSVERSKSAIQSHVWQTRDADWVEVEGERRNEKAAPAPQPRPRLRNIPHQQPPQQPRQQRQQ